MLSITDIVIAIVVGLAIRDAIIAAVDWAAETVENRRFAKELDALLEELEESQARAKHPAGRKRAIKKAVKKK